MTPTGAGAATDNDRYTIISSDTHAGGSHADYREYLDPAYVEDFDAWRNKYKNPFRDLQKKDGQFTRGKGFETFCPVGPWIVPKEEVAAKDLRVRTVLDGEVPQDAPVTDMIFPVSAIIAFVM